MVVHILQWTQRSKWAHSLHHRVNRPNPVGVWRPRKVIATKQTSTQLECTPESESGAERLAIFLLETIKGYSPPHGSSSKAGSLDAAQRLVSGRYLGSVSSGFLTADTHPVTNRRHGRRGFWEFGAEDTWIPFEVCSRSGSSFGANRSRRCYRRLHFCRSLGRQLLDRPFFGGRQR